jgi:hypothetical protein
MRGRQCRESADRSEGSTQNGPISVPRAFIRNGGIQRRREYEREV